MITKIIIKLINGYQRFISPLLGARCRFYPTCSHYSVESLQRHGLMHGTLLSIWRILRCGPWTKGGIDPVP
ncbi:MAG: membrane protein insertion efficiency factor YidD [Candidatus Hatepunaea meridiana]|nr:membrane protein insertion efficiency factor YidD [Candidatus Hatepunaea meridiana]